MNFGAVGTLQARMIFQNPAGLIERIADRDIDVFMRMIDARITGHRHFLARNVEPDPDIIGSTLVAAAVRRVDDDGAAGDPRVKFLQFGDLFPHAGFHRG